MTEEELATWHLYILRCKDGTLYTGITNNLERRFEEHQSNGPRCAKYLRGRQPVTMIYHTSFKNKSLALKAEIKVKKLTASQKKLLASGQLVIHEIADTA
ncbi:GIY-YIG nuclease family protein [Kangiella sediminilitoris]|uniref:Excinuclease ABC C subunit domain protein n=1 Tax=Kangiella sediminilitoris TaxID=1144748 RepID=A0A1B3BA51_9GAMM|nr:GIY-YIG nuclease family protein [Kangiella sediminilitoris]AOE49616.1 Excinuclease ABC C subunit domain protein [Kangiella sediminilitoris]